MRVNLGKVYCQTITIINKIDAKDSKEKQDEFRATIIDRCMWSLITTRTVEADGTVTIGTSHRVQIPESVNYKPYKQWVASETGETVHIKPMLGFPFASSANSGGGVNEGFLASVHDANLPGFTIRTGDYIVKGIVGQEINASNFRQIIKEFEPDAFQVQTFRDATKGEGFEHSTKGVLRFIEPYVIEG